MYHTLKKMVVSLFTAVAFLAPPALAHNWNGPYLGLGVGGAVGSFAVDHTYPANTHYSLGRLIKVPVSGRIELATVGWRFRLGHGLYFGPEVNAFEGDLTGTEQWHYWPLRASLRFTTRMLVAVALCSGLSLEGASNWYFYSCAGVSGARDKVTGIVSARAFGYRYSKSFTKSGWAPGPYAGFGFNYAVGNNVSIGLGIDHFWYKGHKDIRIAGYPAGRLTAKTDPILLALRVEYRF